MKTQTVHVTITPEDVRCSNYSDIRNCSLALAIKRNPILKPYFDAVGGVDADFLIPKFGEWSVYFGKPKYRGGHETYAKLLSEPMVLPNGETIGYICDMIEHNYNLENPIEIKISFEFPI